MVCGIALAQNLKECVYLKNGSIIKGTILEQVPDGNIKIRTSDGSVFVYEFDQVEKITRDIACAPETNMNAGAPNVILSWVKHGQVMVTNGDQHILLRSDSGELGKYMPPIEYSNYLKGVHMRNTGIGLFAASLAASVLAPILLTGDTFGSIYTGAMFCCIATPIFVASIPLWCVGLSKEKNAVAMSNTYRPRYTVDFAPSVQQMNSAAITGHNDVALGATIAFRF